MSELCNLPLRGVSSFFFLLFLFLLANGYFLDTFDDRVDCLLCLLHLGSQNVLLLCSFPVDIEHWKYVSINKFWHER